MHIFIVGALLAFILWLRSPLGITSASKDRWPWVIFGTVIFLWINVICVRSVHHYQGVPYETDVLFESATVQTSLSILWGLMGLSLILLASRKANRLVWFCGASFLAVVAMKLFLIDLSKTGSLSRIISFVGVGLLFVVIGYLSPLPPDKKPAVK